MGFGVDVNEEKWGFGAELIKYGEVRVAKRRDSFTNFLALPKKWNAIAAATHNEEGEYAEKEGFICKQIGFFLDYKYSPIPQIKAIFNVNLFETQIHKLI